MKYCPCELHCFLPMLFVRRIRDLNSESGGIRECRFGVGAIKRGKLTQFRLWKKLFLLDYTCCHHRSFIRHIQVAASTYLWHSIAERASHDVVIPILSILRIEAIACEKEETFPRVVVLRMRLLLRMAWHTTRHMNLSPLMPSVSGLVWEHWKQKRNPRISPSSNRGGEKF